MKSEKLKETSKKDYRFLPKGKWKKFYGQRLNTGDIILLKNGELCFVDSGYTTGDPSRISSMPENWSFSFDNGAINDRIRNRYGDAFIGKSGWVYRAKEYDGKKVFKIDYLYRINRKLKVKR